MMLKKLKITIVEDDTPIREMYKLKLQNRGYDITTASDGISALDVLQQVQPDLILLDIRLPHLPGNEVLKRIRDTDWGQSTKVIVLTNISKNEAPQDFRFMHVDRYIVKIHYTPSQVLEIIKEVLGS
jgi:DNA-binding response OmpR family regulator